MPAFLVKNPESLVAGYSYENQMIPGIKSAKCNSSMHPAVQWVYLVYNRTWNSHLQ